MKYLRKLARNQWVVMAAILILASGVGFTASFLASRSNAKNQSQAVPTCKETCVNLLKDRASPDTLAVTVGSYVTFNSADGNSHQLYLGEEKAGSAHTAHPDAGSYDSGEFKSDESWRVQFKQEGTYIFSDKFNPKTNIIVVVYTPGKEHKVQ